MLLCVYVYCVTSLTDVDCPTFLWDLQLLQDVMCMLGIALPVQPKLVGDNCTFNLRTGTDSILTTCCLIYL